MAMRKHFRIITERNLKAALIALTTLCLLVMAGCLSRRRTEKTVTLEAPRSNAGIVVEDKDPNALEKLSQAIDALELDSGTATKAPMTVSRIAPTSMPQRIGASQALRMANGQALPADATRVMSLTKLSDTEINAISARLELDLGSQGYMPALATLADALPRPPQGIRGERILARTDTGGTHVLRFGFQSFVSQPPQFWVLGVVVNDAGALAVNPDLAGIEPAVTKMLTALDEMRKGLTVRDLETRLVQLSYVNAKNALAMLKGMGITTMSKPEEVPAQVEFAKLPYVASIDQLRIQTDANRKRLACKMQLFQE